MKDSVGPSRPATRLCGSRTKEVYDGDVGYVTGVESDGGELTVTFDGRSVIYGFGELDTASAGLRRDDP